MRQCCNRQCRLYLQEQYNADAETWSSEQAALQADLAALAAQTALKSLALDAMMRNSNRATQSGGGYTVGGPLWQQVSFLPLLHPYACMLLLSLNVLVCVQPA